jgi:hypothetical protein
MFKVVVLEIILEGLIKNNDQFWPISLGIAGSVSKSRVL